MMSRSSVVGITCSSVGLSTRFFILIICIIVLTSLVLVLLLSSLFLFIKMLKNSKHAQNLMASIYNCLSITPFQEDSVHFPPELTDPALLAEVNYFSVQRFACSFYKMTCLEHQLKAFEKHVSQRNSILYFAFCSGGFLQAFSRPKSERGDKHPIPSLFTCKNSTSAGRL